MILNGPISEKYSKDGYKYVDMCGLNTNINNTVYISTYTIILLWQIA